jgi:hypothetical protein
VFPPLFYGSAAGFSNSAGRWIRHSKKDAFRAASKGALKKQKNQDIRLIALLLMAEILF